MAFLAVIGGATLMNLVVVLAVRGFSAYGTDRTPSRLRILVMLFVACAYDHCCIIHRRTRRPCFLLNAVAILLLYRISAIYSWLSPKKGKAMRWLDGDL